MIIYYAVEGYAEEGYWIARQAGFRQFVVPAAARSFSVPLHSRRFSVPAR